MSVLDKRVVHEAWHESGFLGVDFVGTSVYAVMCEQFKGGTFFKIGLSKIIYERLQGLYPGVPLPYARVMHLQMANPRQAHALEAAIHRNLKAYRTKSEWFHMDCARPEDEPVFIKAVDAALFETVGRHYDWRVIPIKGVMEYIASDKRKPKEVPKKRIRPRDFTSAVKLGKLYSS